VREVAVHRHDDLVPLVERHLKSVSIGSTESGLAGAVQHLHAAEFGGSGLGQRAGAIRAVVVDDEDVGIGRGTADSPKEVGDVVGFVVGGNHDQGAHGPRG
jgi:hypothetical protein